MAAGDAYTERFDKIISDFDSKTKCVDDTLLWSSDIKSSFFQACSFLTHCSRNGIVFNQLCLDVVDLLDLVQIMLGHHLKLWIV